MSFLIMILLYIGSILAIVPILWLLNKFCVLLLIIMGDKTVVHEFNCENNFWKDFINEVKYVFRDNQPPSDKL